MILDHAFVLVRPWRLGQSAVAAADEIAEAVARAGFLQGTHRRHPDQGTENRCFRLERFMIELLFVVSREEAGSERSRPLSLLARLDDPAASPFGFASRPARADCPAPGYPSVPYRPAYLPAPLAIEIARDVTPPEPLWFHLPFVMPDDARPPTIDHPNGARRLDRATLASPAPLGAASDAITRALDIDTVAGPHHLALHVSGPDLADQVVRPHEHLPLTFHCRRAS